MREQRTGKRKQSGRPNILGIITETRYPGSDDASLSQDDIDEAIEKCWWRGSMGGVDICNGNISPCMKEIEAGRCDALKRLFAKYREVSSE